MYRKIFKVHELQPTCLLLFCIACFDIVFVLRGTGMEPWNASCAYSDFRVQFVVWISNVFNVSVVASLPSSCHFF